MAAMTDITVVILTGNEELHIGRCLEKLRDLNPRQIVVVESQKGDRTHEVAIETGRRLGWRVAECLNGGMFECLNEGTDPDIQTLLALVWHDWPGLQSTQFNWMLDQLERTDVSDTLVRTEWILRLDADEYLTEESIAWLKSTFPLAHSPIPPLVPSSSLPNPSLPSSSTAALEFTLERRFCGGVIRHGTNGIKMVRMFRRGHGRYAETVMDERIVYEGELLSVPVTFYDDNLNSMDWWREKHRGYARREAEQALAGTSQDPRKAKYYRLPPYLRAILYFCIRYFLKLGFLDGYAGWMWNFWQGLWYRWIVDREISRLRREERN